MKRLGFVVSALAALAISACSGGNEDTVQNVEMNQPAAEDLNAMANDAAADAANAEAAALGNQEEQLNTENAAEDSTTPTDEDEQNVSGM